MKHPRRNHLRFRLQSLPRVLPDLRPADHRFEFWRGKRRFQIDRELSNRKRLFRIPAAAHHVVKADLLRILRFEPKLRVAAVELPEDRGAGIALVEEERAVIVPQLDPPRGLSGSEPVGRVAHGEKDRARELRPVVLFVPHEERIPADTNLPGADRKLIVLRQSVAESEQHVPQVAGRGNPDIIEERVVGKYRRLNPPSDVKSAPGSL